MNNCNMPSKFVFFFRIFHNKSLILKVSIIVIRIPNSYFLSNILSQISQGFYHEQLYYASWIRFFIANVTFERFPSWAILICFLNSNFLANILSQISHFTMNSGKTITCVNRYMKKDHGKKLSFKKRTHTGEKPNDCRYCAQGFSQSQSAKIQERTHNEEKTIWWLQNWIYMLHQFMKEGSHSYVKFVAKDLPKRVTWLNILPICCSCRNETIQIFKLWSQIWRFECFEKTCTF